MKNFDVAIIGGGAAGLMAAIWASKNKSVLLIEKNNILGKKILSTGNGRCNLTNLNADSSHYYGSNKKFISSVLANFNQNKTISFFKSLGLDVKEEDNGRIFPKSNNAQSVVNVLEKESIKNSVNLLLNSEVTSISYKNNWIIKIKNSLQFEAKKIIITTGGRAASMLGSSGDGFIWAKKLGHNIIPTYAALVPIETKQSWIKNLQGIQIKCNVIFKKDNQIISQKIGEIIFTHFGISGPAILFQTGLIAPIVNSDIFVYLDLFPEKSIKELDRTLKNILDSNGAKEIKNSLAQILPLKLAIVILQNINIKENKKSARISKKERDQIVSILKNLKFTLSKLRSFSEAQVTRGGIDTQEINPKTMQSKIIPSLYLAGEIVDVNGDSGGFNLQWAWSSGYTAGTNV